MVVHRRRRVARRGGTRNRPERDTRRDRRRRKRLLWVRQYRGRIARRQLLVVEGDSIRNRRCR
jgi:hypothetical protein